MDFFKALQVTLELKIVIKIEIMIKSNFITLTIITTAIKQIFMEMIIIVRISLNLKVEYLNQLEDLTTIMMIVILILKVVEPNLIKIWEMAIHGTKNLMDLIICQSL